MENWNCYTLILTYFTYILLFAFMFVENVDIHILFVKEFTTIDIAFKSFDSFLYMYLVVSIERIFTTQSFG